MKFKPKDILEAGLLGWKAARAASTCGMEGFLTLNMSHGISTRDDTIACSGAFAEAAANHLLAPLLARNAELEKELEAIRECRSGHENTINEIAATVIPGYRGASIDCNKADLLDRLKKMVAFMDANAGGEIALAPEPHCVWGGGGELPEWHNPDNLTPEQYGADEGWRLLLKDEMDGGRGGYEYLALGKWNPGNEPSEVACTREKTSLRTLRPFPGAATPALDQGGVSATQAAIARVCDGLRDMLLEKNRNYGDSALNPIRIWSKADPVEGINIRLDDKISRLVRGQAAGEDVERDLAGYLILKMAAVELEVAK